MLAQTIINNCDSQKFNPRKFRTEMNISWLINDAKKQFKENQDENN